MSEYKPIPKPPESRRHARTLRKNATKEENHLWYDFLRSYPVRFHRQYVIDQYIVDFFCPKARLIVELDGSQHYTTDYAVNYDAERTKHMESYGFLVLRYTNLDIHLRFRDICEDINHYVTERVQPSVSAEAEPPPLEKGGFR